MGQFNVDEVKKYGNEGNGSFFSLKNDKDAANVRFMYNTIEDVKGYAVHKIKLDDKDRYVNCLRKYNEPVDMCPLCQERYKLLAKFFIPLYDIDADEVKIWDRGKSFITKLSYLCSKFNPLIATEFEIERNGKAGDKETEYEIMSMGTDKAGEEMTFEDLPEIPEVLGKIVLDKTFDELNYFLDNGEFEFVDEEPQSTKTATKTQERNPARDRRTSSSAPAPTQRRTSTQQEKPVEQSRPQQAETRRPVRNTNTRNF